ncbi:MAG: hypothetical protein D4R67_12970, partial [Bacteroidetes bacterium]
MYEILLLNDLNPGKLCKQFDKTLEELASGNFAAAEVKKMTGTGFYRARLDQENRLLFRFGRHNEKNYLLVLELILNHNYAGSRFLRGAVLDDSKLVPLPNALPPVDDMVAMQYINNELNGADGHPIQVDWRDSAYDMAKVGTIVQDFINEGDILFTTHSSSEMKGAQGLANQNGFPGIATFISTMNLHPPLHIYGPTPDYGDDWVALTQYY